MSARTFIVEYVEESMEKSKRGGCGGRASKSRKDSRKVELIKAKKAADAEYFGKQQADLDYEAEMKKFYAPVDKKDVSRKARVEHKFALEDAKFYAHQLAEEKRLANEEYEKEIEDSIKGKKRVYKRMLAH